MPKTLRQKRRIAAEVRAQLVAAFPACFKASGEMKPPLKIGIAADVMDRMPIAGWKLSIALGDYVWGPTYQRSLVAGATRVDLDGNAAGTVTDEEAEAARRKMAKFHRWNGADKRSREVVDDPAG